jgi:SAM-dependent methyltransferase
MRYSEIDKIRERYGRRSQIYDPLDPSVYMPRQELERALISALADAGQRPSPGRTLLEIGCGSGGNLLQFLRLGYRPETLFGVELLDDRVAAARELLPPAVRVLAGDALSIDLPERTFDIVFQSVVFSSILDAGFRSALAQRMWRLAKVGGGVLWYDFVYDNPANNDVRGMPMREVRRLFPRRNIAMRRLILAPPISRRVTRWSPKLYTLLNSLPFLRTHVLCWISKDR